MKLSNIYLSSYMKLEVVVHFKLWHRGTFCWKQNVTFFSFTDCLWREIKCHCFPWNLLVTHVNQKDISFSQWETEVYATCSKEEKKSLVLDIKQSCLVAGWEKKGKKKVVKNWFWVLFKNTKKKLMPLETPNKNPRKQLYVFQLASTGYRLLSAGICSTPYLPKI